MRLFYLIDGRPDKMWEKQPGLNTAVNMHDYPYFDKVYQDKNYNLKSRHFTARYSV